MKAIFALLAVLLLAALGATLYVHISVTPQLQPASVVLVPQAVSPAPTLAHLLVFGDMMLDRAVRKKINAVGGAYLFANIQPLFPAQDLIVANAEGVFTGNVSVVSPSNLVFTFATTTLPILKSLGFSLFSQANNHALNFGWQGLDESKANITAAGMSSFGDPDNVDPGPFMTELKGYMVAFVGYDQFSSDGGNDATALAAIKEAKADGAFVIVYPHWGVEYQATTTVLQHTEAHAFIDTGADAVFGGHPHVVEPIEIYHNKPIFYSMGNFIFDQPWSDTREGLGIELALSSTSATYTLVPFEIQLLQPAPMQGALRSIYLLDMSQSAVGVDVSLRSAIANGNFVLQR